LWRKNGNCTGYTSAGGNVTDTWDAEDRLATVTKGGTLSTFSYDGYSRCIQIVESTSGTVTATKRFVWDGATRCEERNANNNVVERFFPEGEQISGVNYFYTHDRLGSVREVTSASGSILADYAYDAFGNQTLLDGTPIGDVGYAGYFYHANSGLNLTLYRIRIANPD
jgi:YD repeat-containing protein